MKQPATLKLSKLLQKRAITTCDAENNDRGESNDKTKKNSNRVKVPKDVWNHWEYLQEGIERRKEEVRETQLVWT